MESTVCYKKLFTTFAARSNDYMMKKAVIILLGMVLICSCSEKKEQGVKAPTRVNTMVVSSSTSHGGQSYVGIVEEREGTAVSFTSMGIVKRVLVSEGQAVSRGQLIAEMDNTQARNMLSSAEASMAQANDALKRYGMLHDNGSLPEVQWVEIQSKVAQAKSQLDMAKKNLADCRLVAPVSGIIGKKMVGAGETALPSQAVATILDVSNVKVKVAIPETEISSISSSTPSSIYVEAAQKTVMGGKIEKGIQADALTHTYDVRIHVRNADRKLLPGMVASVQFAPAAPYVAKQAMLPVTAIQKSSDGSLIVWTVAKDSTAHRTKVSIGNTSGNQVTVLGGLEMGERVVTDGFQKLSEGTRVVY